MLAQVPIFKNKTKKQKPFLAWSLYENMQEKKKGGRLDLPNGL